jgi:hypothetical protein
MLLPHCFFAIPVLIAFYKVKPGLKKAFYQEKKHGAGQRAQFCIRHGLRETRSV